MADDFDPFGTSFSITPPMEGVISSNKMLLVVFIVDVSRSMEGERIESVNSALAELRESLEGVQASNSIDIQVAIMTFTASAKWAVEKTPINELFLTALTTRPGLTEYGSALKLLDKALQPEAYLNHSGKIAAPTIVFITDGAPSDDFSYEMEQLNKNPYFVNAIRRSILIGDCVNDPKARDAVSKFVVNPAEDVLGAEQKEDIIANLQLATLHNVDGNAPQAPVTPVGTDDSTSDGFPDDMGGFPDGASDFPDDMGGFPDGANVVTDGPDDATPPASDSTDSAPDPVINVAPADDGNPFDGGDDTDVFGGSDGSQDDPFAVDGASAGDGANDFGDFDIF